MMPVERFERAALAPVPWKNGGGVTREIVCRPARAGVDAFDWRVSIAHIAADGSFSTFAGVDRVIVLLDGPGVRLRSRCGEVEHRLDAPLAPFAFDGGTEMECTLLSGESSDFNVMTRRDTLSADVRVIRERHELAECAQGVLLAARGVWHAHASSRGVDAPALALSGALPPDTGIWWDEAPLAWQLEPRSADAALIAVQIRPRDDRRAA